MTPDWPINEKYTIKNKLGQGSFGNVYSAIHNQTGELVAIKEVKGFFDDFHEARRMLREICVMIHLNHPCIVKIKDVIVKSLDFSSFFIVMEHAETDLKKLIRSPTFLDHDQVKFLLYQALVGIKYMHSANILLRDLKPANILINSDCTLKICDFGLSRSMQGESTNLNVIEEENAENSTSTMNNFPRKIGRNKKRQLSSHVVTRWYRAPELILLEKNYNGKIDIWSLGCIYAEILSMIRDNAPYYIERGPIFPGKSCFPLSPDVDITNLSNGYPSSESDQLNIILEVIGTPSEEDLAELANSRAVHYIKGFKKKEKRPLKLMFTGSTSEEIELIEKMLVFSRANRSTVEELLQMPYFDSVRKPELETLANMPADFAFDRDESLSIDEMKTIFIEQISKMNNS